MLVCISFLFYNTNLNSEKQLMEIYTRCLVHYIYSMAREPTLQADRKSGVPEEGGAPNMYLEAPKMLKPRPPNMEADEQMPNMMKPIVKLCLKFLFFLYQSGRVVEGIYS